MIDVELIARRGHRLLVDLAGAPLGRALRECGAGLSTPWVRELFVAGLLELDVLELRRWHHHVRVALDGPPRDDVPPRADEPDRVLAFAAVLTARSGAVR